ncbi:hypothetical protein B0G69_8064 [Paraburkholderia sp. RAU2J]|uniref:hypothetical protein n=1 Tax=Paraburkholderia sp. RAU2J TaxID=1938810 RepID=UPI000EB32129|nr:hypothetical protein [Paraburkholderia sp. RAU2J]RKT10631.1 hypothetical protein B0G69_8064 [Paraburkholderia sp. RAU2J]
MNGKFDMKLVIDAVTTPLLHARLTQASSFRERAALLRSLAEAALRAEVSTTLRGEILSASRVAAPDLVPVPDGERLQRPVERPPTEGRGGADQLVQTVTGDSSGTGHDSEQLADAFQAFF